MKSPEVNIRDPYVLLHEGKYYLYGTRSATTWGVADGFDCYTSEDLENWEGPFVVFQKDESFQADRNYWAPEVYFYNNEFYFITTFGAENKGSWVQILKSKSPLGPFEKHSEGEVTPIGWVCLDGTLYLDPNNKPYLVFSRSFFQERNAGMYVVELEKDLSSPVGEPKLMFYASEAPWSLPFPYAKQEFGIEEDVYFSDGPFFYRTEDGGLSMIWSSWGENGYTVGIAYSDNKEIDGNWIHEEVPLFGKDGGHGMIFKTKEEKFMLALHFPNEKLNEHPAFYELIEENNVLKIKN